MADPLHVLIAFATALFTILVAIMGWIGRGLAARIRHLENIVIGPEGWKEMKRRMETVENRQMNVLERVAAIEQHMLDNHQLLLSNSCKLDRILERKAEEKDRR